MRCFIVGLFVVAYCECAVFLGDIAQAGSPRGDGTPRAVHRVCPMRGPHSGDILMLFALLVEALDLFLTTLQRELT